MSESHVLRRLGRVVLMGALSVVIVGCGYSSSPMGDAARQRSAPSLRYERPARGYERPVPRNYERPAPRSYEQPAPRTYERPAPQAEQEKPKDAAEERPERHPSMWKRKLRAMYACV